MFSEVFSELFSELSEFFMALDVSSEVFMALVSSDAEKKGNAAEGSRTPADVLREAAESEKELGRD